MEAAQQAISSPLLDNVSIAGATGVLVNITGGTDLTLGEVHQINEIIHDAVGDESEIIFGAVNEPAMQGEIRVTVIATGFDRTMEAADAGVGRGSPTPVIPFRPSTRPTIATPAARPPIEQPRRATGTGPNVPNAHASGDKQPDMNDMEIPTFIRRQMD